MRQLVEIDPQKCNLSLTCIRTCPVKAIKIEDNYAKVVSSRCIGCGHCITVCGRGAIYYRHEREAVNELLKLDEPVAALCDPAISAEFPDISDYRKFVSMIRTIGFDYVFETSFGVDLIAHRYRDLHSDFHGKYYIHTVCPPVVSFIEKFQPELVSNLAPLVPPYIAMAKVIRDMYGKSLKIVYISSCVAAKDDVLSGYKDCKIDSVISFTELRDMFTNHDISEKNVEYSEFDPPAGRKGGLFPISRGMLQAVDMYQDLLTGNIIIAEGRNNFLQSVSEFKTQKGLDKHLDLFYCKGCIMGPGTSPGGKKYMRRSEVIRYVNKRLEHNDYIEWKRLIDKYSLLDLSRSFRPRDRRLPSPSESEIRKVLIEMGKTDKEDMLNCGSCGYVTCREFAVAYCQGLTNFEMCYTFTINKLHSFIDKVNSANEKLKNTKKALKESEEKARRGETAALESAGITTAMLDKIKSGVVIVDENLRIVESNRAFVDMIGEDAIEINELIPGLKGAELDSLVPFYRLFLTVLRSGQDLLDRDTRLGDTLVNVSVFTIKKQQVVGGIIRDLTSPDIRKEEIINRAREVIRENLESVQQIAFLLGESASKTEKILTSIIDAERLGADDSANLNDS
ncbi:[Fe-Fe] hydrogenase large subunit C-terminal domain-containing protein [Marinilabiliaceae bacterium ANBcel2]|nr:[Fe-Fe] hydrogenase large subunit C-terminal domain-containing protein [Marinilabiliaceae bacterium ANBcel2]